MEKETKDPLTILSETLIRHISQLEEAKEEIDIKISQSSWFLTIVLELQKRQAD